MFLALGVFRNVITFIKLSLRAIKFKLDNQNTVPSRATCNCVHVQLFHNFIIKL